MSTSTERPPVVACRGVRIGYDGRPLLPAIDLEIGPGELWAIIGRNGCGKTTWLRTLLGHLPPVAGEVQWRRRGERLAYVAQRAAYDPLFPVSAWDVVAMGAERGLSFVGLRRSAAARAAIGEAMEATDTTALARQPFRALSEGQKQRVLLARVVAGRPSLALLDEPTAAMDVRNEEETLALIDRLRRRYGMAVLIVSHFLGVAARFADRVLFMDRESQIVRVGPPDSVLTHVDFATAAALARQSTSTAAEP